MGLSSARVDWRSFDRITVNYLRHECSLYESHLESLFGRVGRSEAEREVRSIIFDAIAKAYPWLSDECSAMNASSRTAPGEPHDRGFPFSSCFLLGSSAT
jgi:hypothetical protein